MSIAYSEDWENRTIEDAIKEAEQLRAVRQDNNSADLAKQVRRLEILLLCNCLTVIGIGIFVFAEMLR